MKRQGVSAEKRGLKQAQTSVRQKSRPQQKWDWYYEMSTCSLIHYCCIVVKYIITKVLDVE